MAQGIASNDGIRAVQSALALSRLKKSSKVGDFVGLQSGVMGQVTEINLCYTRVTTTDLIGK